MPMIRNNKFILRYCISLFIAVSCLFYLSSVSADLSYLAYLHNSKDFAYPPVSILVDGKDKTYIKKKMDPQVLASVRSPRQLREHTLNMIKIEEENKLFDLFYDWFIEELPYEIWAEKMNINKIDKTTNMNLVLYSEYGKNAKWYLRTEEGSVNVDTLQWTEAERLNLFLFYLHQNRPLNHLLALLQVWNLKRYPNVYIAEYHKYMDRFFQSKAFKTFEKDHKEALKLFHQKRKTPLTSLLHEVIKTNKAKIFDELINSPYGQGNINIQDYVGQTPLHIATEKEQKTGKYYVKALLQLKGIKVNVADFRGWRPISYLVSNSDAKSFIALRRFLQLTTPDMQFLDKMGRTLPLLALELSKPKLAHFLYEQGAPLPTQVSLLNTYMTSDYEKVKFQYRTDIKLGRVIDFFNKKTFTHLDKEMEKQFQKSQTDKEIYVHNMLSLENFQPDIIQNILTDKWQSFKDWEKFRNQVFQYDFLWQRLQEFSRHEENVRRIFINSALFDNSDKNISLGWKRVKSLNSFTQTRKILQAVYRGDVFQLKKLFDKVRTDPAFLSSLLLRDINSPLFKEWYQWPKDYMSQISVSNKLYQAQLPNNIRVFKETPLFEKRYGLSFIKNSIPSGSSLQKIIHSNKEVIFYTGISSLLSEAIRANQLEVVQFLLNLGANPTFERNNFVIKNDLITAILGKELWSQKSEDFARYLSIVDTLLNHSSVTKEFLNQEVIPGTQINYIDLAVLKGFYPVVKKMYRKGARVTDKFIWNRSILVEDVLSHLDTFKKTAQLVSRQRLKEDSKLEDLQEKTDQCKKAFNNQITN